MVQLCIWWLTILLWSVKSVLCEQFQPPQVWENVEIKRLVDVNHVYTIESLEFNVRNLDDKANSEYFFALPKATFDQLSIFSVELKDKQVFVDSGFIEQTIQLEDGTEIAYGLIQFPTPIEPNEEVVFNINMSYNVPGEPYPEHISLSDEQQLLLTTTRYPLSAYDTKKGTTGFFGSDHFQEFHPVKGYELEKKEPTLSGTWENIRAFEKGPLLQVLYSHNIPMKEVVKLQRDVWISHWAGTIQFEEYYELLNRGAQLNKGFSRLEHMLDQQNMRLTHYCGVLEMNLPEDSSEHYFTDKVGMVTTHRILGDNIYLKPRYPIFGGWRYNFTLGWTNPLSNFLRHREDYNIISVPLLNGPEDTIYDEVELSLYLPEGAKIENFASTTPPVRTDITTQNSYLDLKTGHVKITLNFENLVDQVRSSELLVSYTYSNGAHYQKLVNIAISLFAALVGFLFLKNINLSVGN